jgi:hypothetical protein
LPTFPKFLIYESLAYIACVCNHFLDFFFQRPESKLFHAGFHSYQSIYQFYPVLNKSLTYTWLKLPFIYQNSSNLVFVFTPNLNGFTKT